MEFPDELSVLFLAFVQGVTEFLPISSSAHTIILPRWLGWEDQGLAVDVAAHFGTLGAVLIYFRKRLLDLSTASFHYVRTGIPSENSRYAFYLFLATIPIVIVGWFGKDFVETHLRSVALVGVTTLLFGLLLFVADRTGQRIRQDSGLTAWYALLIGASQVLALIHGTSRSGITITCALFLGFTRTAAARFSFLLAVPTIFAATVLTFSDLVNTTQSANWSAIAIATITSFITAYLCIEFFLKLVEKIGMTPFVVYRVILGGGILIWVWML